MHAHSTQEAPSERLEIEYTVKPVSGWGGLVAVVRYCDRLGLRALLAQALPDGRTSPNQIPAVEIVLAFFAAVLTGGTRFAHLERLRADAIVRAILGVVRMPSAMTVTRYLGGFVRSQGSISRRCSGGLPGRAYPPRRWGRCSTSIPRSSNATATRRAPGRATIPGNTGGPPTIPSSPCWPRQRWCVTSGSGAGTPGRRGGWKRSSWRPWPGSQPRIVSTRSGRIRGSS